MSNGYGYLLGVQKSLGRAEKPGDRTDAYELLDPFEAREAEPLAVDVMSWDARAWSCEQADRIAKARMDGQFRETRRIRCTCKGRASIATVLVDPSGHTWVLVGPERVPASFQRNDIHDPVRRALPLHRHPNGSVHVEITTCRRCNQDWAIGIGTTQVQVARVRATRGGTLAP